MNPYAARWGMVVAALFAAGALGWSVQERREIVALRTEIEGVRQRAPDARPVPAPTPSSASPASNNELSDEERIQLLRLRAEVTRLRRLKDELLAQERVARAQSSSSSEPAPPAQSEAPAGELITRENARYLGAATPADLLQSFYWAMTQQDAARVAQLLDAASAEAFRKRIEEVGEDKFWEQEQASKLGLRLVATDSVEADSVRLKVQVEGGENKINKEFLARRVGATWQLHIE